MHFFHRGESGSEEVRWLLQGATQWGKTGVLTLALTPGLGVVLSPDLTPYLTRAANDLKEGDISFYVVLTLFISMTGCSYWH